MAEFAQSSELPVTCERAWTHAVSPAGVNAEFGPWLKMTFPAGVTDLTAGGKLGERRFRSWLLALGFLPVEYDDLVLVEVEPGHRFLERSSMFSQRIWQHERIIEATARGCRLTDRVRFESRWSFLEGIYAAVFRATFRLRHRNLRRLLT